MDTNQIYALVNSVVSQGMGADIEVVDASTLISLGDTVLSSSANTEAFLNTLAQRIGKTIISYRKYTSKLSDMVIDDFQMGAILQKIKVSMPTAEEDESYDLTDGSSVDHYKIAKPEATQKLFVTRTPYQYHITIQDEHLREAFTDVNKMGSFLSAIFGEMQNAIELGLEGLGRTCLGNFIAEIGNTDREIKLVTLYNAESGESLTPATAMLSDAFLRFAVKTMNVYSKRLTDMSKLYNDGTETRHTPKDRQKLRVFTDFEAALETVVQWSAFHKELVDLGSFSEMNYFQSEDTPNQIKIKRASDSTDTTVSNIVGTLTDRDALGIYKQMNIVRTTPVNAAGLYYNQYHHLKQLWFNDLSENGLVFTLN